MWAESGLSTAVHQGLSYRRAATHYDNPRPIHLALTPRRRLDGHPSTAGEVPRRLVSQVPTLQPLKTKAGLSTHGAAAEGYILTKYGRAARQRASAATSRDCCTDGQFAPHSPTATVWPMWFRGQSPADAVADPGRHRAVRSFLPISPRLRQ
jgi:hypothetical protein